MTNVFEEIASRYDGTKEIVKVSRDSDGIRIAAQGITVKLNFIKSLEEMLGMQESLSYGSMPGLKLMAICRLSDTGLSQSRGLGFYQNTEKLYVWWSKDLQKIVAQLRCCSYRNGQVYDEYRQYIS